MFTNNPRQKPKPNPSLINPFLTMKAVESADCAAPCVARQPTGLYFFLGLRSVKSDLQNSDFAWGQI